MKLTEAGARLWLFAIPLSSYSCDPSPHFLTQRYLYHNFTRLSMASSSMRLANRCSAALDVLNGRYDMTHLYEAPHL